MRKRKPRGGIFADYVTRRDIGKLLGVSSATISRWEKDGRLPPSIYVAGVKLYKKADIDAWIQEMMTPGREPGTQDKPTARKPKGDKK